MVGVAAHITAASPSGPRYDITLSHAERSSERNGIWMCQTHAKLIDDNPSNHSVAEIERWKRQHEDWVFARVANAANHVPNGVAKVSLNEVGPFRSMAAVKLGRHNVIYGLNNAGKSTFCQALAALSGGSNYERFAARFNFCRGARDNVVIEVGVSSADALKTVRLSQQVLDPGVSQPTSNQRIHIEVDGNVASFWPQSLFNIVILDDEVFRKPGGLKSPFRQAMRSCSEQLRTAEHVVWDSLRSELLCTSTFGYRFRRTGTFSAEILVPDGRDFYLPFENLGGREQVFAMVDVLLELLRADPRRTPWLVIFDTGFFTRLDTAAKGVLVDTMASQENPEIQTIFCVNYEKDVAILRASRFDNWIGATSFGALTIHSFL
jgi:hypothetical protein